MSIRKTHIQKEIHLVLKGCERVLIILHDNPDPDAIASGWVLCYILKELYQIQSVMAYGGIIGRVENFALIKELQIPLKKINRIKYRIYDKIILVDTQPGAGNNSLPENEKCHIVFDHHPKHRGKNADLTVVDKEVGATATLMIEWLDHAHLGLSADMATGLVYAIRSETQDLGREACERDIKAYLKVYQKASIRKLARIAYPKLPRSYFNFLFKGLANSVVFKHLICTHMGKIPNPDLVSEIADILIRHKHMSWALCTGIYKNYLIISLRSSNTKARAGVLIKRLVPDRKNAGGHDMFAGGRIELDGLAESSIMEVQSKLSQDFAKCFGFQEVIWKPLIDEVNL